MSEDANIDGKKSDNADKIPPSDKPKDKITAFDIPKSDTTLSETPASDNSINNNATSDTPNGSGQFKKKKSFWSTFFKIYLYLFSSLLLIIVIFVLFAQTSMFKNWALQFGVKKVNEMLSEKDAVLSVGSIEGNVLSHFKLNDVSLVMKNDTLAKFKQLELEYDVFPLLDNSVVVNKLILESPQVNLTNVIDKNGDSLWNIAYLLKSDKEKDTVKKEFDWKINAVTVEIRNGAFRFLKDKNSNSPIRDIPMKKIEHLDISNLDITDFNLSLGGEF
jgi:hypothetical protein